VLSLALVWEGDITHLYSCMHAELAADQRSSRQSTQKYAHLSAGKAYTHRHTHIHARSCLARINHVRDTKCPIWGVTHLYLRHNWFIMHVCVWMYE